MSFEICNISSENISETLQILIIKRDTILNEK